MLFLRRNSVTPSIIFAAFTWWEGWSGEGLGDDSEEGAEAIENDGGGGGGWKEDWKYWFIAD
jgi:hypothetical protein